MHHHSTVEATPSLHTNYPVSHPRLAAKPSDLFLKLDVAGSRQVARSRVFHRGNSTAPGQLTWSRFLLGPTLGPTGWVARVRCSGVPVFALQELGIATDIVTTAFAILFGAIALAMALSFGLGNRDLAGQVTREWYEQYRAERDETTRREKELEAKEDAEMATEYPETTPTEAEGKE